MPELPLPEELGPYTVSTGLASVDYQAGAGQARRSPGAGQNTFASIVIYDLPPNQNRQLNAYPCDLSDFMEKDTRRFFIGNNNDIVSVVADSKGSAKLLYNHTNASYGYKRRFPLLALAFRTGEPIYNLRMSIFISIVAPIVAGIVFGLMILLAVGAPTAVIRVVFFIATSGWVIAPFSPLIIYLMSLAEFKRNDKIIQWVKANRSPQLAQAVQAVQPVNAVGADAYDGI